MNDKTDEKFIIEITQRLLDSISRKDWESYCDLTDEQMTCVEPETGNDVCIGMKFHEFYFKLDQNENLKKQENIINPNVQIIGDVSVISYRRVTQISNSLDKSVKSVISAETRVFKKNNGKWKMIHFHRS